MLESQLELESVRRSFDKELLKKEGFYTKNTSELNSWKVIRVEHFFISHLQPRRGPGRLELRLLCIVSITSLLFSFYLLLLNNLHHIILHFLTRM